MGVRSIINLRSNHTDRDVVQDDGFMLINYPMLASRIDRSQLMEVLTLIANAPKPVLIHCRHGADRTGAVCAAYRIVEQNWQPDQAINEMVNGPYGYHKYIFVTPKNCCATLIGRPLKRNTVKS